MGHGLELMSSHFMDMKEDVVFQELDFSSTEGNTADDADNTPDDTPPANNNKKQRNRQKS